MTRDLLALTTNAVAQRAGVETAVGSRWWPSEEALALDALRREWLGRAAQMRRVCLSR